MRKGTKKELAQITKLSKSVKPGDLYRAFHLVGDDDTKVCIEDALRSVLDEDTFHKVVAVFKFVTTD